MKDGPAGSARVGAIGLGLVGAAYLLHCLATNRITDDCYITFRYVRNWVDGLGPVFNPGEHVEGYTNFLWTALLAVVHAAFRGLDLLLVAQVLSIAFGAATLIVTARLSGRAALAWLIAPALLAFHAPFIAWSTGALETTLFALLIVLATSLELKVAPDRRSGSTRAWLPPLLIALATMTRPDGIVFMGGIAATRLFDATAIARSEGRARLRAALGALLVFALVYGPYWFWRYHYYGWPVPNTFYAKVGSGIEQWKRGVRYVFYCAADGRSYFQAHGPWLGLFSAWAVVTGWRNAATRLVACQFLCGVFYVVAVGGESLGQFRFMAPLAPLLVVLATWGLVDLTGRLAHRARAASKLLLAAGTLVTLMHGAVPTLGPTFFPDHFTRKDKGSGLSFPGDGRVNPYRWFDNYFVDRLAAASRWLDQNAEPDALVASTPAGSISYHMRQPLLDMIGLNDEHIAHVKVARMGVGRAGHEKGDGRYVLARDPAYILLGNVSVYDRPLTDAEVLDRLRLKSEHTIWTDPEFRLRYERVAVRIADAGLFQWFTFYRRRADAPAPRIQMTAQD